MNPNFDRRLELLCSTCGGTSFEHETEAGALRCVGCARSFTREELLRENGEIIENEAAEMAAEVGMWARDELRKAFSGSKHFKLK